MSLTNKPYKNNSFKKDMSLRDIELSKKGQKIAAALYLVTNHLSDSDPLKIRIRSLAVSLGGGIAETEIETVFKTIYGIESLLETTYLARLISEKNHAILRAELQYFAKAHEASSPAAFREEEELTSDFFKSTEKVEIKDIPILSKGHIVKSFVLDRKSTFVNENEDKKDRSGSILDFINSKKIVSIKDISSLFPSVSEKTVQRELNRLLAEGRIKKRGSKRWSMYLSLDS